MRRLQSVRILRRSQRGFTLIEVAIGGAVIGFFVFLGYKIWQAMRGSAVIAGSFTTAPQSISLSAGGAATFIWNMTRTVSGNPAAAMVDRATTITVAPSPGVTIETIAGGVGEVTTVNQATGRGRTDPLGNVTITIKASAPGTATITATDDVSSGTETKSFIVGD